MATFELRKIGLAFALADTHRPRRRAGRLRPGYDDLEPRLPFAKPKRGRKRRLPQFQGDEQPHLRREHAKPDGNGERLAGPRLGRAFQRGDRPERGRRPTSLRRALGRDPCEHSDGGLRGCALAERGDPRPFARDDHGARARRGHEHDRRLRLDLPSGKGPRVAPVAVQLYQPRLFDVWGQGFGDWGRVSGDGNAASLSRSTGGFVLGGDVSASGVMGGTGASASPAATRMIRSA